MTEQLQLDFDKIVKTSTISKKGIELKRNYLKSGDTTILYNRSHGAYIENCGHYRAACSGGYGLRSVSDKNRILRGSGKFTISKV